MYEWSDEHKMIRDAVRAFVEAEVRPLREELEFGDTPPYEVIRKLYSTFGMDQMARDGFKKRLEAEATPNPEDDKRSRARSGRRVGRAGSCCSPSSSCAGARPVSSPRWG
jgi:hypothetical protein